MPGDIKSKQDSDHIVYFYDGVNDRQSVLLQYFSEGLENNNMCVFATPDPKDKVVQDFQKGGLDIEHGINTGKFKIFNMQDTYLPNHQFIATFMYSNVDLFIKDAHALGFNGLYTAGDMSWLNQEPKYWEEATLYESEVNNLLSGQVMFKGLCIYPSTNSSAIKNTVYAAHPSRCHKGQIVPNPSYSKAV